MKMSRRILAVLSCLVLVLSFSSMAYADASQTFFRTDAYGYRCIGSGRINGASGKAIFNAETLPSLMQTIPPAACSCTVWVYTYDQDGNLLGGAFNNEGTTSAIAEYRANELIGNTFSTFHFNDISLGGYFLYTS